MFCNNFVSLVYLSHLGDICNILLHSIHFISQNIRICIDGKKTLYKSTKSVEKSPWDTWCNELSAFYNRSFKKITAILEKALLFPLPTQYNVENQEKLQVLVFIMVSWVGGEVKHVKLYSRLVCVHWKGKSVTRLLPMIVVQECLYTRENSLCSPINPKHNYLVLSVYRVVTVQETPCQQIHQVTEDLQTKK